MQLASFAAASIVAAITLTCPKTARTNASRTALATELLPVGYRGKFVSTFGVGADPSQFHGWENNGMPLRCQAPFLSGLTVLVQKGENRARREEDEKAKKKKQKKKNQRRRR
ncbi:MAG TPA: hypothetical protein VN950_00795 [Terriglobales bacterium]|nr:hypothetical protein [Terriglobales bacterium]